MRYIAYMETKAITRIILPVVIIALCGFVLIRRQSKTTLEKAAIHHFLTGLNTSLLKVDSARLFAYLAGNDNKDQVYSLINVLKGKYRLTYDEVTPKLKLYVLADTGKVEINVADSGITVSVPVTFKSDYLKPKASKLNLYVQKLAENKYKIFEIDTKDLTDDYIAYENKAYVALEIAHGKYQPITKKAFANALTLKARYDSVIWFSHVKGQTYYYAVKGKWSFDSVFYGENDGIKEYKMGLAGPDLKEVVPAGFDMIRSISGTFAGLVEVEKDHKHGFYNLSGKVVVPVQYDQVFPVKNSDNKAALRMGRDFYWLKNDYTISAKTNLTMAQVFAMLAPTPALTNHTDPTGNITEFNSDYEDASIYIPPSHLTDLKLAYGFTAFKNPLRKAMQVSFSEYTPNSGRTTTTKQTASTPPANKGNWVQSILYSITEHFVGGRFEFYKSNNLVLIDEKRNQAYGQALRVDYSFSEGGFRAPYKCNDYSVRAINDSLAEVKASASTNIPLNKGGNLIEMPMYHYILLKNNKMTELKTNRLFSFTQYVKINDSYLEGCYVFYQDEKNGAQDKIKQETHLPTKALLYMKNEIYASYHYNFKDKAWNDIFYSRPFMHIDTKRIDNVDNQLTAIDKYNIQRIDQKLNNNQTTMQIAAK